MIDATCNFVGDYPNKCTSDRPGVERDNVQRSDLKSQTTPIISTPSIYPSNFASANLMLGTKPPIPKSHASSAKIQTVLQSQYPPQTSSTGSASPNSNLSASVSPGIFPSPTSFSSSPPTQNVDLSSSYTWNPYARTQFPYAQYATPDYYGNMGMSAGPSWFAHQAWPSNSYGSYTFDDIAFQTQLQRRTVRCACPNCTNELSGLPPIVGPDERGRKQHICHIPGCERLYGKASHLKTHLRWHTGERPFVCLSCGKRFSRSDELQRHGRTHTNFRPYSCPICSKKFSRSDHLSKHKKTHFKDKKNKKATPAEEKSSPKKIENETTPASPQKPVTSISGALQQTAHKTATTSISYPPEVPSGYNPYQPFYQSSALFNQHQHASELSIQNQQSSSSNYYSPANMGEAATSTSFANLPHMQYDPLQAMGQSAASYAVKSDTYPSYPELMSNGMMGSSPPTSSNFSLHHPWNAHNFQN